MSGGTRAASLLDVSRPTAAAAAAERTEHRRFLRASRAEPSRASRPSSSTTSVREETYLPSWTCGSGASRLSTAARRAPCAGKEEAESPCRITFSSSSVRSFLHLNENKRSRLVGRRCPCWPPIRGTSGPGTSPAQLRLLPAYNSNDFFFSSSHRRLS